MTWIAISPPDPTARRLPIAPVPLPKDVIHCGSLFLEADLGRGDLGEQTLFMLHRRADVTSHISVQLTAAGELVFARRLGRRHLQATLRAGGLGNSGTVRVSISWNAPQNWGLLTLERVQDGTLFQKEFADPLPWLLTDIERLQHLTRDVTLSPHLTGFGVSDRMEPVGVTPTLTGGAPILTPSGYRQIEDLRTGDQVVTASGAKTILWAGSREVPARGRFRPVRLHAPYFGLREDVSVAPDQHILIEGPEVEYLFNEEAVLVEAASLLNTPFANFAPVGPTIRYYQVLLDSHDTLNVAGCEMESLFAGRLRDAPQVLANTVLAGMPQGHMPVHQRLAYPVLHAYEAVTLRAALLSR